MASVFWKSGRWYQRYKSWGKWRKKASPKGWTKAQALARAWGLEREATHGEALPADAGSMPLRELCEWWLASWCKAPSLARERSRLEANVSRHPIGSWPLEKVTAETVEGRLREMEGEGAAPASVEHVRRTLRTIFNRARKSKLWMKNPAAEAHPRSMEPVRVPETLADEEVAVVLAHVEEPWKRDFVAAAIYTGMRKGELLGLERTAVDLGGGTINVARSHARQTTKGGHRDTIPIARPLRPFLERNRSRGAVADAARRP